MPLRDTGPYAPGYAYCIVHNVPAFGSTEDFAACLEDLAEQRKLRDVRVFAYCLIHCRLFLVAQPERHGRDLGSLVQTLATRHAQRRKGAQATITWGDAPSGCLLDTDDLLLSGCRYVELAPVRAGLVERPEAWPWSSYRFRAGYTHPALCHDPDAAWLRLGETDRERQLRYRQFIAADLHGSVPDNTGATSPGEAGQSPPSGREASVT